jgi:hypothetical protein
MRFCKRETDRLGKADFKVYFNEIFHNYVVKRKGKIFMEFRKGQSFSVDMVRRAIGSQPIDFAAVEKNALESPRQVMEKQKQVASKEGGLFLREEFLPYLAEPIKIGNVIVKGRGRYSVS